MPTVSRRAFWAAAIAAVLVLTAIRVEQVHRLRDHGFFDKYIVFSEQAAHGTIDPTRLPDLSPGYLWGLALLHGRLGLGIGILQVLQIAALSAAALIAGLAGEKLGGRIAAIGAMAVILGSRGALINATDFEPETGILLLGALAVVPLVGERIRNRDSALSGLAFGLSIIFRPAAVLATVVAGLWLWKAGRTAVALFAITAAAPVLIIVAVNARLTGTPVIMDPGVVFYEGMNPLATGYAGVPPRVVNDLEANRGSDAIHVTYRIVAARALAQATSSTAANRFWTNKAIAFARTHPAAAARLVGRRVLFSLSSYDAWDLATMARKERDLGAMTFIPFGFAIVFAVTAFLFPRREAAWPVVLLLLTTMAPIVIFRATARQRNAAIPAVAILAGCGLASMAHERTLRTAAVAAIGLTIGGVLSFDGHAAREDRHVWERSQRRTAALTRMRSASEVAARDAWLAVAQANGLEFPVAPQAFLLHVAADAVRREAPEPVLFDIGLALERAQLWKDAQQVMALLDATEYVPERRNAATSSVAYHLARCRLHQGDRNVRALLLEAQQDVPGDADVLALSMMTNAGDPRALQHELALLHDPFTAELAIERALFDAGRPAEARAHLTNLGHALPEWERPRMEASLLTPPPKAR